MILSLLILLIYNIYNSFFAWKKDIETKTITTNKTFKRIDIESLWDVWVAMTSNIWMRFKQKNKILNNSIYNSIFKIEDILENKQIVKQTIISNNMLNIREYYNFLKTDFQSILKTSNNKQSSIKNIIKQLEIRQKSLVKSIYTSNNQLIIISENQNIIENKIKDIKSEIQNNYLLWKETEVLNLLDKYYILKKDITILQTYNLYLSWIKNEYIKLNNYSKDLHDTLKINIDIISKWSYLVIPDNWTKLLKKFNLIISQEDYLKNQKLTEDSK